MISFSILCTTSHPTVIRSLTGATAYIIGANPLSSTFRGKVTTCKCKSKRSFGVCDGFGLDIFDCMFTLWGKITDCKSLLILGSLWPLGPLSPGACLTREWSGAFGQNKVGVLRPEIGFAENLVTAHKRNLRTDGNIP